MPRWRMWMRDQRGAQARWAQMGAACDLPPGGRRWRMQFPDLLCRRGELVQDLGRETRVARRRSARWWRAWPGGGGASRRNWPPADELLVRIWRRAAAGGGGHGDAERCQGRDGASGGARCVARSRVSVAALVLWKRPEGLPLRTPARGTAPDRGVFGAGAARLPYTSAEFFGPRYGFFLPSTPGANSVCLVADVRGPPSRPRSSQSSGPLVYPSPARPAPRRMEVCGGLVKHVRGGKSCGSTADRPQAHSGQGTRRCLGIPSLSAESLPVFAFGGAARRDDALQLHRPCVALAHHPGRAARRASVAVGDPPGTMVASKRGTR